MRKPALNAAMNARAASVLVLSFVTLISQVHAGASSAANSTSICHMYDLTPAIVRAPAISEAVRVLQLNFWSLRTGILIAAMVY